MSGYDPHRARAPRGILRWLGFAGEPEFESDEGASDSPASASDGLDDPRERKRRQLLTDVSSFLLSHRLEVNPYTLAIAHDVITGADHKLARMVEERVLRREPVTIRWLEEAARNSSGSDGSATLNALMAQLDTTLEEFCGATVAARSATSDYNTALEAQVGELEQVSKAGVVISELAGIARAMLERTRQIEHEMSRSERQTRALQRSLDAARRKAEMDHLTGLPNRRAFEAVLDREFAAATKAGEPLCVAFCDIDEFKRVNDNHGHEAGDRILKAVARTLSTISDDHCHVARHGGEEFVILFRGKSLDEAWMALDTTRETMAERRLVNRATDVPFGRITFSGGMADVFAHGNPREALRAADGALYAAKDAGRNRILRAMPEPIATH